MLTDETSEYLQGLLARLAAGTVDETFLQELGELSTEQRDELTEILMKRDVPDPLE